MSGIGQVSHETYWFAIGYAKASGVLDTATPFTSEGERAHADGETLAHCDRMTSARSRYHTNVLLGNVSI